MFSVQTRVVIRRSPEEVFAFVADQTNAPRWQRDLVEVQRVTPEPLGVGTEHLFVRRFAGRCLESRNRFRRYEPPRIVEFEVPQGWLSGWASYEVEPVPGGAALRSSMNFSARGAARVLEPFLRWVLARDSRRDEERLVAILQGTDPALAPGDPPKPSSFPWQYRTAAVLSWIVGLGFGLPAAYGAWFFAERGYVWTFMGFPTYGDGPFESLGIPTSVPLLLSFTLLCAAEVFVGALLWARRDAGVVMSVVLLPFGMIFWLGFALPFGPALGVAATVLALIARQVRRRVTRASAVAVGQRAGGRG
jgi:hypothetical protein